MARYSLVILLSLLTCSLVQAQFNIPEINKVKEIKLLDSTAIDVQRILVGMETYGWNPGDLSQSFSTEYYSIDIDYSSGQCSEDDDEIWSAEEWAVTQIVIEPDQTLNVKDLGFDFKKFKKEQYYAENDHVFIYHDKEKGLAFKINEKEGEVEKIFLIPPKSSKIGACDNEVAKQFVSSDSWFGEKKLEDRHLEGDIDIPANVTDLTLSESEIQSLRADKLIQVSTTTVDPEGDVLTYNYTVSGGKIIGTGAKVTWDLQGVPAGTYTITAGVDDGCGICGKTMTKSVIIR
jgi:hypothetical protein